MTESESTTAEATAAPEAAATSESPGYQGVAIEGASNRGTLVDIATAYREGSGQPEAEAPAAEGGEGEAPAPEGEPTA